MRWPNWSTVTSSAFGTVPAAWVDGSFARGTPAGATVADLLATIGVGAGYDVTVPVAGDLADATPCSTTVPT